MRAFLRSAALALALLSPAAAIAQQAPPVDPRVAGPTIEVLQSMLRLREAQIQAKAQDDQAQLDATLAKCGAACKPPAPEPPKPAPPPAD